MKYIQAILTLLSFLFKNMKELTEIKIAIDSFDGDKKALEVFIADMDVYIKKCKKKAAK